MNTGSEQAAKAAERIGALIRERGHKHGDAIGQHRVLADLWSQYLTRQHGVDIDLKPEDAMYMLLLLKVSRIASAGLKMEHVEDIAGYAALTMAGIERNSPAVRENERREREILTDYIKEALAEGAYPKRRVATQEEIEAAGPIDGPSVPYTPGERQAEAEMPSGQWFWPGNPSKEPK